ncbi:MAG: phage holin family protein [Lachnospiraceae bacterium]|nr:phage holin family protein [Lachnospiraceae bacterium]
MIKIKFVEIKIKSSEIGFKDFFMKVLIFMLVVIVKILDVQVIENVLVFRMAIIFFYIFNEGISLLDNVRKLRLPFLAKLKSMLEQFDRSGKIN